MQRRSLSNLVIILALSVLPWPGVSHGSDHADPMRLDDLEAGITGLFVFPDGGRTVLILTTRRKLNDPPPYKLDGYEFAIHLDMHSPVSFDKPEVLARYGGEVQAPDKISADAVIRLRLNNDASLKEWNATGLAQPEQIRVWTGVRDDPFIFPRFFGSNVIAMVLSIPAQSFPPGQQDWLVWGTSTRIKNGRQIDHVGRSSRTQLARFDFLNTLPPDEHVAAIHRRYDESNYIEKWLMRLFMPVASLYEYVLEIRHYDLQPDVMIYTTRRAPGYPNGRRLPDDIVGLVCMQGDCILQELAFIESRTWPRQTVNDKDFLAEFPYLAEPWPEKAVATVQTGESRWRLALWAAGLLSVGLVLQGWWRRRT